MTSSETVYKSTPFQIKDQITIFSSLKEVSQRVQKMVQEGKIRRASICHIPGFVEVTEVNTMNTVKRETASKFEGITLNIQNLDDDISEENLRDEFAKFGPIVCCSVCAEKSTRKMRCGTVSFLSPADAANAIACMNGCVILKNTLFVTLASIKSARRRPSPTPYIQRLNTLSLCQQPHRYPRDSSAFSASEVLFNARTRKTSCPSIIASEKSISTGNNLIEFKRKVSRTHTTR